eukprot:7027735-Pyramimonas_sp.AAC.1
MTSTRLAVSSVSAVSCRSSRDVARRPMPRVTSRSFRGKARRASFAPAPGVSKQRRLSSYFSSPGRIPCTAADPGGSA